MDDYAFRELRTRAAAVAALPVYRDDGRFQLVIDELSHEKRFRELSLSDIALYSAYLIDTIIKQQETITELLRNNGAIT